MGTLKGNIKVAVWPFTKKEKGWEKVAILW